MLWFDGAFYMRATSPTDGTINWRRRSTCITKEGCRGTGNKTFWKHNIRFKLIATQFNSSIRMSIYFLSPSVSLLPTICVLVFPFSCCIKWRCLWLVPAPQSSQAFTFFDFQPQFTGFLFRLVDGREKKGQINSGKCNMHRGQRKDTLKSRTSVKHSIIWLFQTWLSLS